MSDETPETPSKPECIIERVVELIGVQAFLPQQVHEDARVNTAAAGAHHQALQRREAHRGIDAEAMAYRRHRGAVAQVGNDQTQILAAEHLRRPGGTVRMAQAVEAVAAHAPFPSPLLRHWVGPGRLGQGGVEGRVKDRHLWHLGQDLLHRM